MADDILKESVPAAQMNQDKTQHYRSITNPYNLSSPQEVRWFARAWQHFTRPAGEIVRTGNREVEIWRKV